VFYTIARNNHVQLGVLFYSDMVVAWRMAAGLRVW